MFVFCPMLINIFLLELDVTWRTIKNDYNTTLIPITIYFFFSASQTPNFSIISVLLVSFLYSTAYIVPFCLSNQLNGMEEDKIEKPDRPLVAGLITPYGAFCRYLIWNSILLGMSVMLNVQKWSLLWMGVTMFHNFLNGDKHFLTKNVISMTLGTAAQFGAAWYSYHPFMTNEKRFWMWTIAIWIGLLANIQDFRDVQGDQKVHRRTLPIIFGENCARIIMAIISLMLGCIIYKIFQSYNSGPLATFINVVILVWHVLLASRLLFVQTHKGDQITYKYYLSFMYCAVAMSSFIFL